MPQGEKDSSMSMPPNSPNSRPEVQFAIVLFPAPGCYGNFSIMCVNHVVWTYSCRRVSHTLTAQTKITIKNSIIIITIIIANIMTNI
jgi:hypothetical protein